MAIYGACGLTGFTDIANRSAIEAVFYGLNTVDSRVDRRSKESIGKRGYSCFNRYGWVPWDGTASGIVCGWSGTSPHNGKPPALEWQQLHPAHRPHEFLSNWPNFSKAAPNVAMAKRLFSSGGCCLLEGYM